MDSGATCHIIAEQRLSDCKIVLRCEVGMSLKGAADNVLPTRDMVDLECKVGQTKVVMRKVVICALERLSSPLPSLSSPVLMPPMLKQWALPTLFHDRATLSTHRLLVSSLR